MKKKITSFFTITLFLFVGLVQTGCFGEFALTRKVYEWNSGIADKSELSGRFINNLVLLG